MELGQVEPRHAPAIDAERVDGADEAHRGPQEGPETDGGLQAPAERFAQHGLNEQEPRRRVGAARGELDSDVGAETVAPDDRPRRALRREDRGEVGTPLIHPDPPASERAAVAAEIRAQDVPVRPERRVGDELRPAGQVAGEAVEEDERVARASRPPEPVADDRAVRGRQAPRDVQGANRPPGRITSPRSPGPACRRHTPVRTLSLLFEYWYAPPYTMTEH